jgi:aminoglycoside phosphotransferase (APT) family kinase protein
MIKAHELEAALLDALTGLTASPVKISQLHILAGGSSQETWRFKLEVEQGRWQGQHGMILRRPLGGQIFTLANDLHREYQVLTAAVASSVPSPRPYWLLDNLAGSPATLVELLKGESIGRKVVRDPKLAYAREQLPAQMGIALAAIHEVDYQAFGLDKLLCGPEAGLTPAQSQIRQIEAELDQIGEPHPVLELALRWLRRNEPSPPEKLALIHGDFRVGNLLVNEQGLVAVIDWEFAHIGDYAEDLAYPLVREWRFGVEHLRLGGIGQPGAYLAAYNAARAMTVDPARVFYWEIMGNVWWALGLLNQTRRHLSGEQPNLEFACLGRRCSEMELELLNLLRLAGDGIESMRQAATNLYLSSQLVEA